MEKDMKKTTQAALAALVLSVGFGSTAAYANELEARPGPKPTKPHKPGKHGCGDKCDGKIKIDLKVDRHCDLDIGTSTMTLAGTPGGDYSANGHFDVRTNAGYSLLISAPATLAGSAGSVPVAVTTRQDGAGSDYTGSTLPSTGNADVRFNVKALVTSSAIDSADAGNYTGNYIVAVKF